MSPAKERISVRHWRTKQEQEAEEQRSPRCPLCHGHGLWPWPESGKALTAQQLLVLRETATGKSVKAIAMTLAISVRTVEFHRKSIFIRLGVRNILEAVRWGIREGLIEP